MLTAENKLETWNPIRGYEKYYLVSDKGRVRSLNRIRYDGFIIRGRILRPGVAGNTGYKVVVLSAYGKKKSTSVHRIVLETFSDKPNTNCEVNHKNGVKTDNQLSNLEWVTRSENMRHAYRLGLRLPTGKHVN